MKRSRSSEEQIVYAIRQAESGTSVGDLCRQLSVSEATFYTWKKKYARLGVTELRRLRQVEEENARLKRLVADLPSTITCCRRPYEKKSQARPPPGTGPLVPWDVSGKLCAGLSVGTVRASLVVSNKSRQGSIGSPAPYSESSPCPAAVRLPADLGVAPAGGLADQSQASTAALSPRWPATPHAGAAQKTHCAPPRSSAGTNWTTGAVEYGFRA